MLHLAPQFGGVQALRELPLSIRPLRAVVKRRSSDHQMTWVVVVQALRASVGRQVYAQPTRAQAQKTCPVSVSTPGGGGGGGGDAGGGDGCVGSRTQRDKDCLCGYQYEIQVGVSALTHSSRRAMGERGAPDPRAARCDTI